MHEHLDQILVSEEQLLRKVKELGHEITDEYQGKGELVIVSIINGSILFTADLIRHINLPVRLDCMRVSSYLNETSSQGKPAIVDMLRINLENRHVLVIDDIIDTGKTWEEVRKLLLRQNPLSVKMCALLSKKARREVEIDAEFCGFEIPDEFVVGYGLDFAELYRNLPCIGVLKPEYQNPPTYR